MITRRKTVLAINLLLLTCLSKIEKQKKLTAQLLVFFTLFLLYRNFSSHHRPKLQRQLFIYKIKALLIKVLPLHTKIFKAKNLILATFKLLDVKSGYIYLRKGAKSQMTDLIMAFMLNIKAIINIKYIIFIMVEFILQEICILMKLTVMKKKI